MTWIETVLIVLFSFLANMAVAWLIFTRANRMLKFLDLSGVKTIAINNDGGRFGGNTKIMLYKSVIVEAII
jgi:hypothetical protein